MFSFKTRWEIQYLAKLLFLNESDKSKSKLFLKAFGCIKRPWWPRLLMRYPSILRVKNWSLGQGFKCWLCTFTFSFVLRISGRQSKNKTGLGSLVCRFAFLGDRCNKSVQDWTQHAVIKSHCYTVSIRTLHRQVMFSTNGSLLKWLFWIVKICAKTPLTGLHHWLVQYSRRRRTI